MTQKDFETLFQDICDKHGVQLFLNDPSVGHDNGFALEDEVHLGTKYSNLYTFVAIAFHEFGHVIINKKRKKKVKLYRITSLFNEEWMAWTLAQQYYLKYFGRPFSKRMGNFALQCLRTHSKTHYAFRDIYKDHDE